MRLDLRHSWVLEVQVNDLLGQSFHVRVVPGLAIPAQLPAGDQGTDVPSARNPGEVPGLHGSVGRRPQGAETEFMSHLSDQRVGLGVVEVSLPARVERIHKPFSGLAD
jgi:hypothetical protein